MLLKRLTTVVKKHQADSLSLLPVTTGTGAILDPKMGLLRKHNISLMLLASIHVQKAGGTRFFLKTLYKIARLEKKEARWLFAKEDFVTSAATNTAITISSITDPDGFTTVSWRGVSSTSPPKQRPQSRSPPLPSDGIKWVNPFDDKFLTSFPPSVGLAMDPAVTVDTANRAKNSNDQKHSSLLFSLVPLSLISPPVGDGSNLNAYIRNPASCQPTKNLSVAQTPPPRLPQPFQHPPLPLPQGSACTPTRGLPFHPLQKVGPLFPRMWRRCHASPLVPPWRKLGRRQKALTPPSTIPWMSRTSSGNPRKWLGGY